MSWSDALLWQTCTKLSLFTATNNRKSAKEKKNPSTSMISGVAESRGWVSCWLFFSVMHVQPIIRSSNAFSFILVGLLCVPVYHNGVVDFIQLRACIDCFLAMWALKDSLYMYTLARNCLQIANTIQTNEHQRNKQNTQRTPLIQSTQCSERIVTVRIFRRQFAYLWWLSWYRLACVRCYFMLVERIWALFTPHYATNWQSVN